jgi:SAM-dependent methyltransferase
VNVWRDWYLRSRRRRAARALERQLEYQETKASKLTGMDEQIITRMKTASSRLRSRLGAVRPLRSNSRTLEVGCGAHGLVFYFDAGFAIGVDPLSVSYARLFPRWQRKVPTIAARGEELPLKDGSFEIVLSDNVVDHAENPRQIVAEMTRVLAPSGVMYFTVNVHHGIYAIASTMHAVWNSIGLHFEIGPFADHTTHLTPGAAKKLFRSLPLRIITETVHIAEAKAAAHGQRRHLGDWLKRFFFKNALFEVIAVRDALTETN